MIFPKSIKVGGMRYPLETGPMEEGDGGGYNVGHFSAIRNGRGRIFVASDMSEQQQAETLLHEILEAIRDSNDLDMTHQTLSTVSAGLFQVIRDNKLDFRK